MRPLGDWRRDCQAGLTLIEVLVVLAIVGVMTGVTVLGVGLLDRGGAETEAMRLADRLQFAADEAMVTSVPVALVWDARGYRFLGWETAAARWRESAHPALGARHTLPAALRLEAGATDETAPVLIAPDLPQALVMLRILGGEAVWRVGFDGLAAEAGPAGP